MLRLPPKERDKFLAAEQRELASIEEREVIEAEVPIPKGVKPIGARMVYNWKDPVSLAEEGNVGPSERTAKARWTMKDFKIRGDNLRETYAPTSLLMMFRFLLLLALAYELPVHHIDINTDISTYSQLTTHIQTRRIGQGHTLLHQR